MRKLQMVRRVICMLLVLTLIVALCPAAYGGVTEVKAGNLKNLVENGDFETGDFTGWGNATPETTSIVKDDNTGGSYAVKMNVQDSTSQGYIMTNPIPVETGATYIISYQLFIRDTNESGNDAQCYAQIFEFDADNQATAKLIEESGRWVSSGGWENISFEYTVTDNTASIRLDLFHNAVSGVSYWDEVSVVKKEAQVVKGPNLLENGSFETGDFSGWGNATPDYAQVVNEKAADGSYAVKMNVTGSDKQGYIMTNPVTVKAGATYTISYQLFIEDTNQGGNDAQCYAYLYEFDNTGSVVKEGLIGESGRWVSVGDWEEISFEYTVTEGTASIRLDLFHNAVEGVSYWDDVSIRGEQDKGTVCSLDVDWFHYYAEKLLALKGTFAPNTTGSPIYLVGDVTVNDQVYQTTYDYNGTNIVLYFNGANDVSNALSETEVNTIRIPAGTTLYDTAGAPYFFIAEEFVIYTQKVEGCWLAWKTVHSYGDDEQVTKEGPVEYYDLGADGTYLITNDPTYAVQGQVVVEGHPQLTLDYKDNKDQISSVTVGEAGDYVIHRIVNYERFDYVAALYRRGDVDHDKALTVKDLVAVKKLAADKSDLTSWSGRKAADTNADGSINEEDASFLRRVLAHGSDIMKAAKGDVTLGQGVMPILGFDGPDVNEQREAAGFPADFITEEVYAMVSDLGINTVILNTNEIGDDQARAEKSLRLAEKYGIKAYLFDRYVSDIGTSGYAATPEALAARTHRYNPYRSFAGYYIYDEPLLKDKRNDGNRKIISQLEPQLKLLQPYVNINSYLNLFPKLSQTLKYNIDGISGLTSKRVDKGDYNSYVCSASQAGAQALSYDMYLRDNDYKIMTEDFYNNLDWMRTIAKNEKKPFYAFAQVGVDFEDDNASVTAQNNLTTVAEMQLEVNAALAMGARGITYYSLIQPIIFARCKNGSYDLYRSGLINVAGAPNNGAGGSDYTYYAAAKAINTYIAAIDHILMSAENKGVIATNGTIRGYFSDAETKITGYGQITSAEGSNALVGCFDYCGQEVYLVVNADTKEEQNIILNFNGEQVYSCVDQDLTVTAGSGERLTLTVKAGQSVLVRIA